MLILIDKRLPAQAKKSLSGYGEVIEFLTSGITYEAISGHPDIFFCQTPGGLVVAPNTPPEYLSILAKHGISFTTGSNPVGNRYPRSAHYNAVVTDKYLIHNLTITDPVIKNLSCQQDPLTLPDWVLHCSEGKNFFRQAGSILYPLSFNLYPLTLPQGYTRCNLIHLGGDSFITSDKGIENALGKHGIKVLYVSPRGIILPGHSNGFFGGCCGTAGNSLFISGSLGHLQDGEQVRTAAELLGLEVIELYDGPLFDGGGIICL